MIFGRLTIVLLVTAMMNGCVASSVARYKAAATAVASDALGCEGVMLEDQDELWAFRGQGCGLQVWIRCEEHGVEGVCCSPTSQDGALQWLHDRQDHRGAPRSCR